MPDEIHHDGELIALIVYNDFKKPGIHFFTPDSFSQQVAYMKHPAGTHIGAHVHRLLQREVQYTLEVLFIKRGKLRVDFYSDSQVYLESRILSTGDVILLAKGGHGFEVLEDLEMFEVKQGPYAGDRDKIRFLGERPATLDFGTQRIEK